MNRLESVVPTALLSAVLLLSACGENGGESPDAESTGTASASDEAAADELLAEHGLQDMDAKQIIKKLEGASQTPNGLVATVGYDELVLSDADDPDREVALPIERSFYLSVAPYIDKARKCHHRSLTVDRGELADQELRVFLIGMDGEVIASNSVTTNANGFVGFWLQRDIDATLQMSSAGLTGRADISTRRNAPTCITPKLK